MQVEGREESESEEEVEDDGNELPPPPAAQQAAAPPIAPAAGATRVKLKHYKRLQLDFSYSQTMCTGARGDMPWAAADSIFSMLNTGKDPQQPSNMQHQLPAKHKSHKKVRFALHLLPGTAVSPMLVRS